MLLRRTRPLLLADPQRNVVKPTSLRVRNVYPPGRVRRLRWFPRNRRYVIGTAAGTAQQPGLVFFYSPISGSCRRVEGFLAQVLQRRRNHGTFKLYRVDEKKRPDLVERFGVAAMPTLVVVEDKVVRARLERPRGCREIETFLAPWLK
ncbi:MAG TPA: thioredoxin family protein [Gaiellaceae bacterium]